MRMRSWPLPRSRSASRLRQALQQVLAARLRGAAQHLRVGQQEVGGAHRVDELPRVEIDLLRGLGVQPLDAGDHVLEEAGGEQVGLLDEVEDLVLAPGVVLEAAVARVLGDHRARPARPSCAARCSATASGSPARSRSAPAPAAPGWPSAAPSSRGRRRRCSAGRARCRRAAPCSAWRFRKSVDDALAALGHLGHGAGDQRRVGHAEVLALLGRRLVCHGRCAFRPAPGARVLCSSLTAASRERFPAPAAGLPASRRPELTLGATRRALWADGARGMPARPAAGCLSSAGPGGRPSRRGMAGARAARRRLLRCRRSEPGAIYRQITGAADPAGRRRRAWTGPSPTSPRSRRGRSGRPCRARGRSARWTPAGAPSRDPLGARAGGAGRRPTRRRAGRPAAAAGPPAPPHARGRRRVPVGPAPPTPARAAAPPPAARGPPTARPPLPGPAAGHSRVPRRRPPRAAPPPPPPEPAAPAPPPVADLPAPPATAARYRAPRRRPTCSGPRSARDSSTGAAGAARSASLAARAPLYGGRPPAPAGGQPPHGFAVMAEEFHRIRRLPPYVFAEVNRRRRRRAQRPRTSSTSAWATRTARRRRTSSPS